MSFKYTPVMLVTSLKQVRFLVKIKVRQPHAVSLYLLMNILRMVRTPMAVPVCFVQSP